ncbi:MAG: T9SS type A sorting domain-containing protein [Bacteroidales bacterium]|nr:T9SS type A sorting domain-containing protein [Bacteroidales bacterium]
MSNLDVWGIARYDDNFMINEFKFLFGVTHPCAGSEGNGGNAIDVLIDGQIFYGTPTYVVVCPDYKMHFGICNPPTIPCLDDFIVNCNSGLIAGFDVENKNVCQGSYVQFEDASNGNITTWEWVFEGGIPATSGEINPMVYYPEPGFWNVTLTVSNDVFSDTKTETAFMEIYANPEVTLTPFEPVCDYTAPFALSGGSPEGGVYSGTGVENGIFNPQLAGVGEHIISYEYVDVNGCAGLAEQMLMVEICTGLVEGDELKTAVYPNPSSGEVFVSSTGSGELTIELFDLIGMKVFEQSFEAAHSEPVKLNLSNVPAGIYLIRVNSGTGVSTSKITLLKE